MVARISASPIFTSVAIGDANARADNRRTVVKLAPQAAPDFVEASLPRSPALLPASLPGEGFVASVIAERLPVRIGSDAALRSRLLDGWTPPPSDLRLTDRRA